MKEQETKRSVHKRPTDMDSVSSHFLSIPFCVQEDCTQASSLFPSPSSSLPLASTASDDEKETHVDDDDDAGGRHLLPEETAAGFQSMSKKVDRRTSSQRDSGKRERETGKETRQRENMRLGRNG